MEKMSTSQERSMPSLFEIPVVNKSDVRVGVIGGGAAGFFGALAAKTFHPQAGVTIFEKSSQLLAKVRISGGGRCNVTHACFDPRELVKNYPRGHRELLGPFTRFQPRDTIEWFESRGVHLKTEEDGRIFPVSDRSQEVIDCLVTEARRLNIDIKLQQRIDAITCRDGQFILTMTGQNLVLDRLLLATGSHPSGHHWARGLGHTVTELVPSLFTFNIPDFALADLAGISVSEAMLSIVDHPFTELGPLLITHWGLSGPAALKLSAYAARLLHQANYQVLLSVNWVGQRTVAEVRDELLQHRQRGQSQAVSSTPHFAIPKNLWKRLVRRAEIAPDQRWGQLSEVGIDQLCRRLADDQYSVKGKTTNKAEFVTCGGVTLSEINFKTMESRICPGLYFAGEILDIDGITGGFNFQNAWTTGYLAGRNMAQESVC